MRCGFVGIVVGALCSIPTFVGAADLRITDVSGAPLEVKDCEIDYTHYTMFYSPDFVRNGIRAYLGDGIVTIEWSRIARIEIRAAKKERYPYRLTSIVTLTDGVARDMDLVMDSDKQLRGRWAASQFSIVIPLEKVKSIEVVKAK